MLGNVLLTLPFFLFQNLDTCGGFCLLLARKKKAFGFELITGLLKH